MIVLPAGSFALTIAPALSNGAGEGDLNLTSPVTITGAGARATIIDGRGIDRIFDNASGNRASITDLTITGGVARRNSLLLPTGGGGIWNAGDLTVQRVTITGNRANYGGGLFSAPSANAVVDSSTVSNNVAGIEAGGIRFDNTGTVINSTITGNRVLASCCTAATADGGFAGEGGGIDMRGIGQVSIISSTITRNEAVIGGGGVNMAAGYRGSAGRPDGTGGPLRLRNSIIAGNTTARGPANCKRTVAPIISLGGNIASDNSCFLSAAGDRPGTNPQLGTFGNNGGPTDTYALMPNSPAVDATTNCPPTDQRDVARPRGSACDIGAFEL